MYSLVKNIILSILSMILIIGSAIASATLESSSYRGKTDKTFQETAEINVEYYIRGIFNKKASYKMYNFGKLTKIVPKSIVILDSLKSLPSKTPEIDTLIVQREKYIEERDLRSYFLISHLFEVKQEGRNESTLYEFDFYLNQRLEVENVSQQMEVTLNKNQSDWLYHYMLQYPLFNTQNPKQDRQKSKEIYDFYNNRLSIEKENKAELILAALMTIENVYAHAEFLPELIVKQVVRKWMNNQAATYANSKSLKFSKTVNILDETETELVGYQIFHSFSYEAEEEQIIEKTLYFEFDPYFVLIDIMEVSDQDDPFKE